MITNMKVCLQYTSPSNDFTVQKTMIKAGSTTNTFTIISSKLWQIQGLKEGVVFEEFIDSLLRKEIQRKYLLIWEAGYGCVHLYKSSELYNFHMSVFAVLFYFNKRFLKNLMILTTV